MSTLSSGQVPGVVGEHSPTWRVGFTQSMNRVGVVPVRDVTCRVVVRVAADGAAVRVHLSNVLGIHPIELSSVTVGPRLRGAALARPPSVLTVGGEAAVALPAGREVTTDPLVLPVRAGEDLAVSFAVRGSARLPEHSFAAATGWCSAAGAGDLTRRAAATGLSTASRAGLLVSGVDVSGAGSPATAPWRASVVAVGDSLTDAPVEADTYVRWTDALGALLPGIPVVNAGIAGNRVLMPGGYGPTLRDRFDSDVLLQAGAGVVVLLAGTNDISTGASSAQIVRELEVLTLKTRQAGLQMVLATIPPAARRSAAQQRVREDVNSWIRTRSAADVVVDADAALRDPTSAGRLRAAYDHGDGLHLSAAGHAALARAVASALG